MKFKTTLKWLSLLAGLIIIFVGILYMINPLDSSPEIIRVVAVLLILVGIFRCTKYFTSTMFHFSGFLVSGILDIILGLLMIYNISASMYSFSVLMPMWILTNGISDLAISFDEKRVNISFWWTKLVSSIIGIILGFVMIININLSIKYIIIFIGIYLVIIGLDLISTFISLVQIDSDFKILKNIVDNATGET